MSLNNCERTNVKIFEHDTKEEILFFRIAVEELDQLYETLERKPNTEDFVHAPDVVLD